ncbi:MAG: hypothetical protein ACRC2T_01845, partial [Thermoguttaceae bacterium]
EESFQKGPALQLVQFLSSTTRGIISERRSVPAKTHLRIHDSNEDIEEEKMFAFPLKANVG